MLDRDGWEELRGNIRRFIGRRVADAAAVEDMTQEVLLRAHVRRGELPTAEALRHWSFRVAANLVVDRHRRRGREAAPEGLPAAETEDERDAAREGRGLAACLPRMIEGLPARYRRALELVDLAGMTQQDAAPALGLSVSGAKSRVQRGRAELRRRLLACCRVELDKRGGVVGYEPTAESKQYCGGEEFCVQSGGPSSS